MYHCKASLVFIALTNENNLKLFLKHHFMSQFSDNLISFRKKNKLTQKEVAAQISSSLTQIRRWETAETSPSIDNAALLAKCYNVSLDELYGSSAENSNSLDMSGLSEKQVKAVMGVIEAF
jgi:transcriptional regulator with XRE-family HTH domain